MPRIVRHGDSAGGAIVAATQSTVRAGGARVAVVGDPVTPHGPPPHNAASMATGSPTVSAEGIRVCRVGDVATCGHRASGGVEVYADEHPAPGLPEAPQIVVLFS